MKIYSYLSAAFLAGMAVMTSCTKEEGLGGDVASQGLQITVSAAGFENVDGSRTIDNDLTTYFASGDAIGVFAVRGGEIVEGIENRKFTYNGVSWDLEGDAIEYKGTEFSSMKFYGYYPYDADITIGAGQEFDPAKSNEIPEGDPFENYVSRWTVGNDQSENYSSYDLMTSVSSAEGERLQGKVSFTMQHRMALASVKMPTLVWDFTNAGVDDYNLEITPLTFTMNGEEAQARYDETTGTYRMLVKPGRDFTVGGTYQGAEQVMQFNHTANLESGKATQYNIVDNSKKTYTLNVGDFFCADGTITSGEEDAPENAIGIVTYIGNPQPHVTHPDNNTKMTDALFRDYPNCTHGLVVALDDSQGTTSQFSGKGLFSTWFSGNEEWSGKFVGCNTGNSTSPIDMFPGYQGYNNTTLLTMCYESGSTTPCDPAYTYIMAYREAVAVPSVASVWYIPSLAELQLIYDNIGDVNAGIRAAGGTELTSTAAGVLTGFYWSSNERNDSFMWLHHMDGGPEFLNRERGSRAGYFRMMLAF